MAITTQDPKTRPAGRTSVGLKVVMAITGVLFLLFLLAHMYGNLKAFAGQSAYDGYANHLRTLGEPILPRSGFLWLMGVVLIVSVVQHVWAAVIPWRRAHRARSTPCAKRRPLQAALSSRTMRWWGRLTVLLFVILHLLQFTTVTIQIGGSFDSPYRRLVAAFQVWYIVVVYALAMVALGMHLRRRSELKRLPCLGSVPARATDPVPGDEDDDHPDDRTARVATRTDDRSRPMTEPWSPNPVPAHWL